MISIPQHAEHSISLMVGSCKDSVRTFSYQLPSSSTLIELDAKEKVTHAIVQMKSGKKQMIEFYHGAGYYSQQPQYVVMDKNAVSVSFYNHSTIVKTVKKQ